MRRKRKYNRFKIVEGVTIIIKDEQAPLEIQTLANDISLGGLRLCSHRPIKKDTPVLVKFTYLNEENKPSNDTIEGRVCWLLDRNGNYYIGISFKEELSYQKLPGLYVHLLRKIEFYDGNGKKRS